ncbi:unnamed protein product [Amoebophrya sp. A25]|nr:unnamed protein product [Amoebophrya sp. A25]|eukprot:GSA25T00013237001.1
MDLSLWIGSIRTQDDGRDASEHGRLETSYTQYKGERLRAGALVAKKVQELHDAGYAHMDLKPENALIDVFQVPSSEEKFNWRSFSFSNKIIIKLFDFDTTLPVNMKLPIPGLGFLGTVAYADPFMLALGAEIEPLPQEYTEARRCDMFSLGGLRYTILIVMPPKASDVRIFHDDGVRTSAEHSMGLFGWGSQQQEWAGPQLLVSFRFLNSAASRSEVAREVFNGWRDALNKEPPITHSMTTTDDDVRLYEHMTGALLLQWEAQRRNLKGLVTQEHDAFHPPKIFSNLASWPRFQLDLDEQSLRGDDVARCQFLTEGLQGQEDHFASSDVISARPPLEVPLLKYVESRNLKSAENPRLDGILNVVAEQKQYNYLDGDGSATVFGLGVEKRFALKHVVVSLKARKGMKLRRMNLPERWSSSSIEAEEYHEYLPASVIAALRTALQDMCVSLHVTKVASGCCVHTYHALTSLTRSNGREALHIVLVQERLPEQKRLDQYIGRIDERTALSPGMEIGEQLSQRVQQINEAGYAHLDVRPANMIVAQGNGHGQAVVKLINFGTAQPASLKLTKKVQFSGVLPCWYVDPIWVARTYCTTQGELNFGGDIPVPMAAQSDKWSVGVSRLRYSLGAPELEQLQNVDTGVFPLKNNENWSTYCRFWAKRLSENLVTLEGVLDGAITTRGDASLKNFVLTTAKLLHLEPESREWPAEAPPKGPSAIQLSSSSSALQVSFLGDVIPVRDNSFLDTSLTDFVDPLDEDQPHVQEPARLSQGSSEVSSSSPKGPRVSASSGSSSDYGARSSSASTVGVVSKHVQEAETGGPQFLADENGEMGAASLSP